MEFIPFELSGIKSAGDQTPHYSRQRHHRHPHQPNYHSGRKHSVNNSSSQNTYQTETKSYTDIDAKQTKSCDDLHTATRLSRPLRRYRAARWFIQHIMGRTNASSKGHNRNDPNDLYGERRLMPEFAIQLTSEDIKRYRSRSRRVLLNVGGEHHEVLWETLARIPNSRLGRLSQSTNPLEIFCLCDEYVPEKNEFYFDRPSRSFSAVLGLYRTGHLHIVDDVCVIALKDDLTYWGVSEHLMDACCLHRYYQRKEQMEEEIRKTNEICTQQAQEEQFGRGKCANLRKKIWDLVEKPQTSMAARVFAVISITFILLSIIGLNLSTMPSLRLNSTYVNDTTPSVIHEDSHLVIDPRLETLELVCTIWFTFEFVVRFSVAPNKCAFAKSPMNLIDVIAILPFYFSKIFEFWLNSTVESLVSVRKVVQMFRILRILRVFKLARHSQGLQALGYTLTQSYKELGLLMMFVILVVLLFSSLAYFAEKDENAEMFTSIPATFWWAIITMTTVGYGDMTPKTVLGKVIGSFSCICGVLVVGLPIPIIVNNFTAFYQDQMRRDKVLKHQQATEILQLGDSTVRTAQNPRKSRSPDTKDVEQTDPLIRPEDMDLSSSRASPPDIHMLTKTNLATNRPSDVIEPILESNSSLNEVNASSNIIDPLVSCNTQVINEVKLNSTPTENNNLMDQSSSYLPNEFSLLITNRETTSTIRSSPAGTT